MADILGRLRAAKDKAFKASDKASDSGGIALNNRRGFDLALRDNRAARRAWEVVVKEGQLLANLPPMNVSVQDARQEGLTAVEDGMARTGELDVAYNMILEGSKNRPRIDLSGRPMPGGTQEASYSSGPSTGKTLVVLGGLGALAAKLAGWW